MGHSYTNLYSKYLLSNYTPNDANEIHAVCPFHEDNKPSFSYNEETGLWYCFVCDTGGDAIQFVRNIEECSFEEAKRIVNESLGNPTLPSNSDIEYWQYNLRQAPTVQAYLTRRGITDKALIEKYKLGWDGERITIPIYDSKGELLNVRRLRVSGDEAKVINWRGFGKNQIWPIDQLEGDKILLCAGEIDALSAIQQGYNAVTGTGGETNWRKELSEHFRGKDVYIVYDADDTGRKGAKDRAVDLGGIARAVYIVNLEPEGADINDLHQQGIRLDSFIEQASLVGSPGTRLVDGAQLLREAEEEAKKPWLVENLMRPGWLGVLGGHGKGGKTTLATHLMGALVQGKPFLGREVQASPTLYVNYEMAVPDLVEMFQEVIGDDPNLWPKVLLDPPKPLTAESLQPFLGLEPGLVVIDSATPAFSLRGDAENSAGEVGYYLRSLQDLARHLGWSILIIHHLRKSGEGSYLDLAGSREWIAAPDVLLTWSKGALGEAGTLRIEGRVPPVDALAVMMDRTQATVIGTQEDNRRKTQIANIVEALRASPGMTAPELVELLEISRPTMDRLLKEGGFYQLGSGKRGDPYRWFVDAPTDEELRELGYRRD